MTEEEARYLLFDQGYDCGQTVLAHFAEDLDLEEETAYKLAAGFGGGMQQGDMCGCVTGALMALGLKYGFSQPGDKVGKDIMSGKTQEFLRRFQAACGAIRCRDLLGADVGTPEGKLQAGERIPQRCPAYVCAACEILAEMLGE